VIGSRSVIHLVMVGGIALGVLVGRLVYTLMGG
jgi:hypothetical protein